MMGEDGKLWEGMGQNGTGWEEMGVSGSNGEDLTMQVFFVTILEPLLGIGNKPVLGRRTLSRRCRRYG